MLHAKVTAKKLVNESGLNEEIKILATKEEIKKLATKAGLKAEQDKIVKIETYDLGIFISKSYFINHGAQLYVILQPLFYNSERLGDTTTPTTTDNSLSQSNKWCKHSNFCLTFNGSCLKKKLQLLFLLIE